MLKPVHRVASAAFAVLLPALKSVEALGTRRVGHSKTEHRRTVNGSLRVVVPSMPISHSHVPRTSKFEQPVWNGRNSGTSSPDRCEIGQMPEVPPGMNVTPHAPEQFTSVFSSSNWRKGRGTTQARPPLMSAVV